MTECQKNMIEKTPTEIFLTKPLPPTRVKIVEACDQVSYKHRTTIGYLFVQVEVQWSLPDGEGHSNLVGYKVQLR